MTNPFQITAAYNRSVQCTWRCNIHVKFALTKFVARTLCRTQPMTVHISCPVYQVLVLRIQATNTHSTYRMTFKEITPILFLIIIKIAVVEVSITGKSDNIVHDYWIKMLRLFIVSLVLDSCKSGSLIIRNYEKIAEAQQE